GGRGPAAPRRGGPGGAGAAGRAAGPRPRVAAPAPDPHGPGGAVRRLPARADVRLGRRVVARPERRPRADDDVEQEVAERADTGGPAHVVCVATPSGARGSMTDQSCQ